MENNKELKDKPIKVVIEDNAKVSSDGNVIEIKKHLSSMEVEKMLNDIFGTTNIGVLDCGNIDDCDNCKYSYEEEMLDGTWQLHCIKKLDNKDGSAVAPYDCCDKFERLRRHNKTK